jgi:DNA-binding MarR family transcriptional regulator
MHSLYERPGFLLRRAHQISTAIFERACADMALTPAQYGVLTILADNPGIDQSSLARALAFDKVTVLRVLKGLEERGLCRRTAGPSDRRQMAVTLNAAGRKLLQKAQAPVQDAYEALMKPLNAQQRRQLLDLLQTLTQSLEPHARASFVPIGS